LTDLIVQNLTSLVEEWSDADEHLVDQNSDRPPVHCLIVVLLVDKLWRFIFGSTNLVVHGELIVLKHFGVAKVDNFDVSI